MLSMIKIGDWYYPRRIGYSQSRDRICIEIKMLLCSDCDSCAKRYREVRTRLESLGLADVIWEKDGVILSLPNPHIFTEEGQLTYLRNLFGVPVYPVETVVRTN